MKKILYLHASAELYGSDYTLLNLLKALDRKKFYPEVILPFKGPLCGLLDEAGIDYFIHDLAVLRRNCFTVPGLALFGLRFLVSFIFLVFFIHRHGIEIVHTNTSAVWVGGIAAKLLRRKHIWQVMELVEKPRIVFYAMSRITGIFSDRVFTISDAVRKHFLVFNKGMEDKFETLYHGVDLKEYDWRNNNREKIRNQIGIDKNTFVVGMAGRINQWKGQDVFVDCIPEVLGMTDKNIHFLILGGCFKGQEHYEKELVNRINRLSVQSHVTVPGFQKNFADWLSAMDVFVLPSKLPEPNATVTLAAMAMKLPVIGTNIGGTRETVLDNETGFLIEPSKPFVLAEKILSLIIMDRKLRVMMGEQGYLRVKKKFSLANYCQTVIRAYTS